MVVVVVMFRFVVGREIQAVVLGGGAGRLIVSGADCLELGVWRRGGG